MGSSPFRQELDDRRFIRLVYRACNAISQDQHLRWWCMMVTKINPNVTQVNNNGSSPNGHNPKLFDYTKEPRYALIQEALASLSPSRIDSDDQRREIGMALYSGYDDNKLIGLALYDGWCQKSPKYKPGMCAAEWMEFESEWDGSITLDHLYQYAKADNPKNFLKPAPKKPKPSHYKKALKMLGCDFSVNQMNDVIYVNNTIMSDIFESHLITELRE